jgi:hypothetical protein
MLIHTVYFWLKSDLNSEQRDRFRRSLESLAGIASVEKLYVGTPAPVPKRPVLDDTYSFSITVVFKDLAAHNVYQVDPLHLAFMANCKAWWTRVQVYDAA